MTFNVPSDTLRTYLAEATSLYQGQLKEDANALEYLNSRGITSQVMDYFRLGLVADPLPEHTGYRGRLSIPYVTKNGIVKIRFKAIPDGSGYISGAKILDRPGATTAPYNVKSVFTDKMHLVVTEGEPDTWTGVQCGLPTLGFPGAKSFKPHHPRLLRYRTIYVVAHNDDAGVGAAFADTVTEHIPDSHIIMCPEGHDLNSFFIQEGGPEDGGTAAVKELIGL